MKITVFGSSTKTTPQAFCDAAFELGQLIAAAGHTCTNGGGKFGVMGSLSDGARDKGGEVIGIIHEKFCFDGEEDTDTMNMIISRGLDLTERKQLLYDNGDCIIVLPGGVGTFDELWESICAKSLNMKGLAPKPICIVNVDGYYDGSIMQLQRAFDDKLLYLSLDKYVHVAGTVQEALEWTVAAYNASLGAPIEDYSSSRKSIKLSKEDPILMAKEKEAAIFMLNDDEDDKIPDEKAEVPNQRRDTADVVSSSIPSHAVFVPLATLLIGLIAGYSLAKSRK